MCPEDTVRIPLYAKDGSIVAHTLVDKADADFVNRWRWSRHECNGKVYAGRCEHVGNNRSRIIRLHRVFLGLAYGDRRQGDHINRDTLDNRRSNLRIVTKGQNGHNVSPQTKGTSQFRGVSWNTRRQLWVANVKVQGRLMYLGGFSDELQAAETARSARLRLLPYATD